MIEKNNVRPFGSKIKSVTCLETLEMILHSSCLQALC